MKITRSLVAFTLVELLVVLAILSILASLLLPALGRAGGLGRSAACRSNLRQLQLAWALYLDENADRMVSNHTLGDASDWSTFRAATDSWVTGSAMASDSTADVCRGALWCFTGSEAIYRCPSDRSTWRYGTRRAPRPRNLSLSLWMNGGWNDDQGKALDPLILERSFEIRDPAAWFTFMDEDSRTVTHGTFWVARDQDGFWWQIPGARDAGCGANLAHADGHVAHHRWRYPGRAWEQVATPVKGADDRADLAWLVDHVPSERTP